MNRRMLLGAVGVLAMLATAPMAQAQEYDIALISKGFQHQFWQAVKAGADKAAAEAELPLQLFLMLEALPLAQITSFVAIILVIVFFVTSSDSGSLVIDVISAGGKVDAPTPQRVFWCVFEGLVAIALILGGGLAALQAMSVSTGFPFTIVLLVATIAVIKGLASEPRA